MRPWAANEGTGADGGFLIQTDFAGQILESAVRQSPCSTGWTATPAPVRPTLCGG